MSTEVKPLVLQNFYISILEVLLLNLQESCNHGKGYMR
jgi:hypothetical protein